MMPPAGNDVIADNLGGTHRCDLCGQCTVMKRAGLYHFSNECTHAGLARFQRTLRFACLDLVLELARRVRATCGRGIERHRAALHRIGGTAEHKYAQHRVGMMATIDDVVRHLTVSVRAARNDPAVWGNAYMQAMVYQTLLALPFSIYALTHRPQGVAPPWWCSTWQCCTRARFYQTMRCAHWRPGGSCGPPNVCCSWRASLRCYARPARSKLARCGPRRRARRAGVRRLFLFLQLRVRFVELTRSV